MNRKLLISLLIITAIWTAAPAQSKQRLSAEDILQGSLAKLLSLKSVRYRYHQDYDYASEGYRSRSDAESFLEFTPLDKVIGLKFQFKNSESFSSYNGSEVFELREKDKTIKVEPNPKSGSLGSWTYLQFSPLMLRNALPAIIGDRSITKSVTETRLNSVPFYVVEFALDKAFFDSAVGTIQPMSVDRKTVYRLTIDRSSFMPVEVYRGNNVNKDFNRTTYSEIVENPKPPAENTWYYSTYLNEYEYATPPKDNLIKPGETAYEINLPMFQTSKVAALSDLRGKVVLLDFWIFHCGYCQDSVPELNALQEKYKGKNFKLLTVNVADSPDLIKLFVKKTRSRFPILYNGAETGKKYGVAGYPTVVLIGKDGKVLYSGRFGAAKLEEMIDRNL